MGSSGISFTLSCGIARNKKAGWRGARRLRCCLLSERFCLRCAPSRADSTIAGEMAHHGPSILQVSENRVILVLTFANAVPARSGGADKRANCSGRPSGSSCWRGKTDPEGAGRRQHLLARSWNGSPDGQ